MDSIYQNLNKKNWTHYKNISLTMTITKDTFHTRLVNLAHVKFSNDEINTLNLGFYYAIERNPPPPPKKEESNNFSINYAFVGHCTKQIITNAICLSQTGCVEAN
jgi:hypothetical protein